MSPNPFDNGGGRTATIKFWSNEDGKARLTILNSAGTTVKTYVERAVTAGVVDSHIWNGLNVNTGALLPTGTYRARVDLAGNVRLKTTSFTVSQASAVSSGRRSRQISWGAWQTTSGTMSELQLLELPELDQKRPLESAPPL